MGSWWRRIAEQLNATGNPGSSWKKKVARHFDALDDAGRSYAQKIAKEVGTERNQGSWAKRMAEEDATASSWAEALAAQDNFDEGGEPPLSPPDNITPPSISGNAYVGQTLTATTGTWANTPTGYAYQWCKGGVDIGGATNSTYQPVSGDIGSTITVRVTASNAAGSDDADSSATAAVIGTPVNTVAPAVTGTPTVGETLSCTTGTWSGGGSQSFAYQWKADGFVIIGATASTFLLTDEEIGAQMTCDVIATNAAGSGNAATSNATSAVAAAQQAPVNGLEPEITGTPRMGEILSCSTGVWSHDPDSYTYQWYADAEVLSGETDSTLELIDDDLIGREIHCGVTATNEAGSNTAFSDETVPVYEETFAGALGIRSTNQSIPGSSVDTTVDWNSEVYDYSNPLHDPSSNSSRFVVPAQFDGDYFRMSAGCFLATSDQQLGIKTFKDGAAYAGMSNADVETAGNNGFSAMGAPIPMASGTYGSVVVYKGAAGSVNLGNDGRNWGQFERLPHFKGALVTKQASTGDQVIASGGTVVNWQNEIYDTHGFFAGGSPTVFTIPAGVTLVRVQSNLLFPSASSTIRARVLKNGSHVYGSPDGAHATAGVDGLNVKSALIEVAPGDTISLEAFSSAGSTLVADNATWFSIEAVPASRKRCLLRRSSNYDNTGGTDHTIPWQVAEYDVGDWWDVNDPTVIIIPEGVSKIRMIGNAVYGTSSSLVQCNVILQHEDSIAAGSGASESNATSGQARANAVSAIIPVAPGERYKMVVFATDPAGAPDPVIGSNTGNWFAVEALEEDPSAEPIPPTVNTLWLGALQ